MRSFIARNGLKIWVGMKFTYGFDQKIRTVTSLGLTSAMCDDHTRFHFDGDKTDYKILNKKCVEL